MNVLFIYTDVIDPQRGGVERVTSVLSNFLNEKKINSYYLSLSAPIVGCKIDTERQYFIPEFNAGPTDNNLFYLKTLLKEKSIDIVINQGGLNPRTSRFCYLCKKCNVKLISVVHSSLLASIKNASISYATKFKKNHVGFILPFLKLAMIQKIILYLYKIKYKRHYNELCCNSDRVVLLSQGYIPELIFFLSKKMDLHNILAIPNPCSLSTKYCVNTKSKVILYVGRIDMYQKRVDLLLQIWKKLYQKYSEWTLIIVGGGDDLEKVQELSKKMDLERIKFEGFKDPKEYYAIASIFCMTSTFEGFPMVLPEAMGNGVVPVVFNSYSSVADIIDDKVNGFLIQPFSLEEFRDKISLLIDNLKGREHMARQAYKKSEYFSINKIGQQWLNLFNEILS